MPLEARISHYPVQAREYLLSINTAWQNIPNYPNFPKPKHLAIIADGRKADVQHRHIDPSHGYFAGMIVTEGLMRAASVWEIGTLTVSLFMVQQITQAQDRRLLFEAALDFLSHKDFFNSLEAANTRFNHVGSKGHIPAELAGVLLFLEQQTSHYQSHTLNLAIGYEANFELQRALMRMQQAPEESSDKLIDYLDTAGQPGVNLVIRTAKREPSRSFRTLGLMPLQTQTAHWLDMQANFPALTPSMVLDRMIRFYSPS